MIFSLRYLQPHLFLVSVRSGTIRLVSFSCLLFGFLLTVPDVPCASGRTLLVPDHYPSLQQAIRDAKDHDFIMVAPGEYHLDYGNITIKQEYLTVKSTHGAEYTAIIGKPDKTVITIGQGSKALIEGFTITSAKDEDYTIVDGGAFFCDNVSSPLITHNIIAHNKASFGAGIYCDNTSTPAIHNNLFIGNVSIAGGAIFVNRSAPDIHANRFYSNEAVSSGGAIFVNRDGSRIIGNIFWKNKARSGGAIGSERGAAAIINNTIVGNSAVFGGGLMVDGGAIRLINLIIWKNEDDIYYTGYTPFTKPAYSDISDGDFRGTNGNISDEPLFVDPDNGNFRLQEKSPCIDTGNPEPMFFDLGGSKNDIGAFGGPRPYTEK